MWLPSHSNIKSVIWKKIYFINSQITVFKIAEEKWLDMFYEYRKLTTEQRANDQHRRIIKNLSLWFSHGDYQQDTAVDLHTCSLGRLTSCSRSRCFSPSRVVVLVCSRCCGPVPQPSTGQHRQLRSVWAGVRFVSRSSVKPNRETGT